MAVRAPNPDADVTRVIDYDGVQHVVRTLPDDRTHGFTLCDQRWDWGPCTNIEGHYTPAMREALEGEVSCFVCIALDVPSKRR